MTHDESHLNKCKIALYTALIYKPVNAYSKADVDLMMILTEEPIIQDKLEAARERDNAKKV